MNEQDERDALAALLRAHPQHGKRPITIAQCLRCNKISKDLKENYKRIMAVRLPHK